jgi:N-acetylmuramoyl-L-alanine amidase
MLRSLVLIFFLVLSLHAISDSALLKRANANISSMYKSDVFRAYNDYKTLYLRSIMNDNENLKIKALKGIIKSGNKLHIDVSSYQKELKSSSKKKHKKKIKYKKIHKKVKKRKKPNNIKLNYINKLKSIYWRNDKLIVKFEKNLKKKYINYFRLYNGKKNIYKYVFEIKATLNMSKTLSKRGIKSVKIAQFKQDTIRIVFFNDSPLKIRFKTQKNLLIINVNISSKKSKKQIKTIYPSTKYYKSVYSKTIVIDPGHGGKDPGAIGYKKLKEKDIVLAIAKQLRYYLIKKGYKVYMTRDNDKFIKLRNRTKYANKKKADLFISIHANATKNLPQKAQGIETYFLSPSRSSRAEKVAAMENKADIDDMNYYGKKSFLNFLNSHKIIASNKLAIDLQRGILNQLQNHYKNVIDGGVREGPFWVLVGAQMPAVLIEVGFITNANEAKRLSDKTYQKYFAKGIAEGIERYFLINR